ncbi:MAG: hypothetical protein DRG78_18765 [Epsilonproteobacteria bacterium]|nr:MAG: hypothetical protein DRG78_18765 [Campylobacterota bacterium]
MKKILINTTLSIAIGTLLTGCMASSNFIATKSNINKLDNKQCLTTPPLEEIGKLQLIEQNLYVAVNDILKLKNIDNNKSCRNIINVKYDILDDDVVLLTVLNKSKSVYTLRLERKCCGNRTTITQYTPDELAIEVKKATKKMLKDLNY